MKSFTAGGSAIRLIAIGSSAGGVQALITLLAHLPPAFAPAVVLVLHVRPGGRPTFGEFLGRELGRAIVEPEDKEPIRAGGIYAAPAGYHLLVGEDFRFHLSDDEPVHFARPSIDVAFTSVAEVFGPAAVGVILTGANDDGAAGLAAIARAGGCTIVQDPDEAAYDVMPRSALEACPRAEILEGSKMAAWFARLTSGDGVP